ncbi:MAG: carbamate kinase [Planctomycetota bacterium]|nr:MAG: carbamate kinase [Planctomycetota bacterium]
MGKQRVVVAIGGNSIIDGPEHVSVLDQYRAICRTAERLADLVQAGWELACTHGNGPQVGFMLRRSELARDHVHEIPLDSIDADTQGALGYHIQQALGNALRIRDLDDRVAAVVTQVVVDPHDPAFKRPTKPIGRFFSEVEARAKIAEQGWNMVHEKGRGWRRVVPSPRPGRIVEEWAIRTLLDAGAVVVGCGGGGIPVVPTEMGLRGVPAVIDKDLASAQLALQIGASHLVFSTGVDRVCVDFGGPNERPLEGLTVDEAKRLLAAGEFPAGSMGPKIQGAIEFLEGGGKLAVVTSPRHLLAALRGEAGTRIVP